MSEKPNILTIIIDQFRADCVFGALAEHLDLPNIRGLADEGVSFHNHYSVVAPCGPSRASLLTGQYAMNHRAVRNGTPLRADTPTLGTELRKAGYDPLVFGYTDVAQDPRSLPPDDPRLRSYEEIAAGFTEVVRLRMETDQTAWFDDLAARGIEAGGFPEVYRPVGDRPDAPAKYPAEASDTAFLTDRTLEDLAGRAPGWCALVNYLRPHSPFNAPAPYNQMYDPTGLPDAKSADDDAHPFIAAAQANAPIHATVVGFPELEPTAENTRMLRAIYFALATEVDHHVGRLLDWLRETGAMDETIIVLTSDHGEMLGDFGLWGKSSYHDAAFHVPLIVRLPDGARGDRVEQPTESVDLMPTLLDLAGVSIPPSVDGHSLVPFLRGEMVDDWRSTSFSELDFGNPLRPTGFETQLGVDLDSANLAVLRHGPHRLVHFAGDLPTRLFNANEGGEAEDLANDPAMMPILLDLSRRMLCHRMQNAEGTFSRTMITPDGPVTAG